MHQNMTTHSQISPGRERVYKDNSMSQDAADKSEHPTLVAADGTGPLLQRDYWAVIEHSSCAPEQVMSKLLAQFPEFAPSELANFACAGPLEQPLRVGDAMQINIKMSGLCQVRIAQVDERSFTMRTLEGHPEAGRITFGAYYDERGQLTFRIRSRARASTSLKAIGYNLFGKMMQTRVWVVFIERLAAACGGTIQGEVQTAEKEIDGNIADTGELHTPTFVSHDCVRVADSEH